MKRETREQLDFDGEKKRIVRLLMMRMMDGFVGLVHRYWLI